MPELPIYADLHTHTTCSDGRLSPSELVEHAADRGVKVMSVTDHDTVAGLSAAREAARKQDVDLVPGVELSVTVQNTEIHLLAYEIDPSHGPLREHLGCMAEGRRHRARRMIELLREEGVDVEDETLRDALSSSGAVGRPHIAGALVRAGFVESTREAFETYLDRGRPAFVEKPEAPAERILDTVHDAGGLGVLAHPGHWTSSERVRQLISAGLDGIEVVHPSHDRSLVQYYGRLADGYGVLQTGGSDYHGWSEDDEEHFGRLGMTRVQWERFRAAIS